MQKYNMFVSHIGCATLGVIVLAVFGLGWVARNVSLATSVAVMIYSSSFHPPSVFPFIYPILGIGSYTIFTLLESISLKLLAFSIKFA